MQINKLLNFRNYRRVVLGLSENWCRINLAICHLENFLLLMIDFSQLRKHNKFSIASVTPPFFDGDMICSCCAAIKFYLPLGLFVSFSNRPDTMQC